MVICLFDSLTHSLIHSHTAMHTLTCGPGIMANLLKMPSPERQVRAPQTERCTYNAVHM